MYFWEKGSHAFPRIFFVIATMTKPIGFSNSSGGFVVHRISYDRNVFVVEILGAANFDVVIEAIKDAYSQPDYFVKNNIFIFSSEYFEVKAEELEMVTQYILENIQNKLVTIKSAVVVPPGFNTAIVELWATAADRLPYDLKIFSDLKSAEDWTAHSGD